MGEETQSILDSQQPSENTTSGSPQNPLQKPLTMEEFLAQKILRDHMERQMDYMLGMADLGRKYPRKETVTVSWENMYTKTKEIIEGEILEAESIRKD